MDATKTREHVRVTTAGGEFVIDVTASAENGLIDEVETPGEAMAAVRDAFKRGDSLLDYDGRPTLVEPTAILALRSE